MTAIWQNNGTDWHLLVPTDFPYEATLHTLVEDAPHLLPLAGDPHLIVLGREVQLGNGYTDLIAIKPSGRIAVIEIKLTRNAEARRAVIAQVLNYAAYLWRLDARVLEQDILRQHLQKRGYENLAHAVQSNDQEGSFDAETFTTEVGESLKQGRFRLVFVLDEAPEELIQLDHYLQAMSDQLVIDLITISSYTVNVSQVLVPQRIEAERQQREASSQTATRSKLEGLGVEGADDFIAAIAAAPQTSRPLLQQLAHWAQALEQAKLVKLLPRLVADNACMVSIYNNKGTVSMQFWRSVFERRAPSTLALIEATLAPIKQGNTIREIGDELLEALTEAYKEAVGKPIEIEEVGG